MAYHHIMECAQCAQWWWNMTLAVVQCPSAMLCMVTLLIPFDTLSQCKRGPMLERAGLHVEPRVWRMGWNDFSARGGDISSQTLYGSRSQVRMVRFDGVSVCRFQGWSRSKFCLAGHVWRSIRSHLCLLTNLKSPRHVRHVRHVRHLGSRRTGPLGRWFSMVHGQVQLHVRMCDETAQLQGEAIGRLGDGTPDIWHHSDIMDHSGTLRWNIMMTPWWHRKGLRWKRWKRWGPQSFCQAPTWSTCATLRRRAGASWASWASRDVPSIARCRNTVVTLS